MNKLEVPKTTFLRELKIAFNAPKRALSANRRLITVLKSLLITVIIFLWTWLISQGIRDYFVVYSVLVGLFFYVIESTITKKFRKRIISDMESAMPLEGQFGFSKQSPQAELALQVHDKYALIVSSLAGILKIISQGKPDPSLIKVKKGKFFIYFEFKDIENLDMDDLRKFVAEPSALIETNQ